MNLSDSINNAADLTRLKEFVKLPENKLWLGQVSQFYRQLGEKPQPQITTPEQLHTASTVLLALAQRGINLIEAAGQCGDVDDQIVVNRFCDALKTRFESALSPQMAARKGPK